MKRIEERTLALLLTLGLCAACGSGGSSGGVGGNPLPSPDTSGPIARIYFPTANSITDGDHIGVTGSAFDPSGVVSVTVNGVPATTEDRFQNWIADIPLMPGENVVSIVTTDELGNVTTIPAVIVITSVGPFLTNARDMALDPFGPLGYLVDSEIDALVGVDRVTGDRVLVSGLGVGTGPPFFNPKAIALFGAGTQALVLDGNGPRLIQVDLVSGDRTIVSDATTGAGAPLVTPFDLAIDEASDRAFVCESNPVPFVVEIDLATGDRTPFSGNGAGSGATIDSNLTGLSIDTALDRLFVTMDDALLSVSLTTGERTIVSDNTFEGPVLDNASNPLHDPGENQVYLTTRPANGIIVTAVDLLTGDRTTLSDATTGVGPALTTPRSLVGDFSMARVLAVQTDSILAIDLFTGDRSELTSTTAGIGPAIESPGILYGHLRNGAVLLQEVDPGDTPPGFTLKRIDLGNGNRDIEATSQAGTGVTVLEQFSFECDRLLQFAVAVGRVLDGTETKLGVYTVNLQNSNRELCHVLDGAPVVLESADIEFDDANANVFIGFQDEIWEVNLDGNTATQIVGGGAGSGPAVQEVRRMTYDLPGQRLIVTDPTAQAIFLVDTVTLERRIVSNALTGSGPMFQTPVAIDVDFQRRNVLITDTADDSVFLVNISSGDRTQVVNGALGSTFPEAPGTDVVFDSTKRVGYATYGDALNALVAIDLGSGSRVIVSR